MDGDCLGLRDESLLKSWAACIGMITFFFIFNITWNAYSSTSATESDIYRGVFLLLIFRIHP